MPLGAAAVGKVQSQQQGRPSRQSQSSGPAGMEGAWPGQGEWERRSQGQ